MKIQININGYDAEGERSLKLTGQTIQVNQNGQSYHIPVFDKQTLYASPLITINDEGYTKHYFEEGKRICSKIGSGELHNVNDNLDGISDRADRLVAEQQMGVEKSFEICMGMYSTVKTYNLNEYIIQPYQNPIHPDEPIFYYHSDHLGSASFLTDNNGNETQQLVYLPYGEDWVDLKYNTQQFETPYKFNGKEKDLESGYNYYGARYYYDWLSIWLSVDPLSDKYPHLTSYNYCANNPVMLVDPDGEDVEFAGAEEKRLYQEYRSKVFSDNKKYGHIQKELIRLEEAEEKFRIRMGDNITSDDGGGNFVYNKETSEFDINISDLGDFSKMEKLSHELKHADQYMDGKIAFRVGNRVDTYINSEQNERYAYNRQIEIGSTKVNRRFLDKFIRDNKSNFDQSDINQRKFEDQLKSGSFQQLNDHLKKRGEPYFIHKSLKN